MTFIEDNINISIILRKLSGIPQLAKVILCNDGFAVDYVNFSVLLNNIAKILYISDKKIVGNDSLTTISCLN